MNKTKLLLLSASLLTSHIDVKALSNAGHEKLIAALIRVESSGRSNAIGDNGQALGCLQIHDVMLQDYIRITGKVYHHSDMLDAQKSLKVARTIFKYYDNHIKNQTGMPATAKELSMIWNGGGGAWTRASKPIQDSKQRNLERYWSQVRRYYK